MSIPVAFALALAASIPLAPAFAETSEEAVAYAFLGLAADATLDRGAMHLSWRQASDSPAVFVGHGEGGGHAYDVTFTVTAIDDCDYEISLAGPPAMVRGGKTLYARVDLSAIDGVASGEFQTTIEGDGYCQTGALNPNCTLVRRTDIYGALDPARHARLVEQLLVGACPRP